MTIRRHVPLPLKLATAALAVAAGAVGGLASWQALFGAPAGAPATSAEVETLRARLAAEHEELLHWSALANGSDSQLKVERATARGLAEQLKALEAENARLKSDLAYLESLLPAGPGEGVVAIRRFQVEPDEAPNRMRYRALLATGGSEREFKGSLQIVLSTVSDGKPGSLVLPDADGANGSAMQVAFRHYQRVEGEFAVPDGVTVTAVQLRVLERGTLRAQQSVSL